MKASILDLEANKILTIELPAQFEEEIRPDLIKRSVLSILSKRRQIYGAFPEAGQRAVAKLSRRRRDYATSYGKGMSRVPRKTIWHRGTQFGWVGAVAPGTVKGRKAHPPKATKIFVQKINKKENKKAIRSAISASIVPELLKANGFKFNNIPLILEEKFEAISKTKDLKNLLIKLGLRDDLVRTEQKSIRAGKGKIRNRKYKKKKGPLIVVSKQCPLVNAAKNIQGFDVVSISYLNTYLLAPGTKPGRLVIWSKQSIEKLKNENLFMANKIVKVTKALDKK